MRRRVAQPSQTAANTVARKRRAFKADPGSPGLVRRKSIVKENKVLEEEIESAGTSPSLPVQDHSEDALEVGGGTSASASSGQEDAPKGWKRVRYNFQKAKGEKPLHGPAVPKYDPEDYGHAKKKLKKAVLECYRCVRIISSYEGVLIWFL